MSTNTDDIISGGLFAPIQSLKLNDTFYTWYNTTNTIIDALNPLAIYDVASGPGVSVTKITGGVAVVGINAGCGLTFDSNVSLCLDINGSPETTTVDPEDYYIIEKYNGTNITTDSSDCETLFKIQATNLLPYTVSGDHDFIGGDSSLFKVTATNFNIDSDVVEYKTNNIYLNNNPQTTNDDFANRQDIVFAGITVHAFDEEPTLGYDGSLYAWKSNQNFSVTSDRSFVSDSAGTYAIFNFSTKTASQSNVALKLLTGSRQEDTDDGKVFTIKTLQSVNKLMFNFYNQQDTFASDTEMFSSIYDEYADRVLFNIEGTVYIRDIEESSQFLTESDYTAHKVPLTNGYGVVDYKYTNRFVTSNYDPSIQIGDLVRFEYSDSTNTTEDIYVVAAQADTEENSKVVGIVEDIVGGNAIIALTGVFEYNGESVNITSGDVFYLSTTNPGLATSVKPSSGIIKEVFVGVGPSKGIMLSSGVTKEPFFSKVQISGGSLVESETSGDTVTFKGGTNVNLSYTTNNEIEINAGSLYDADYWSSIETDTGWPNEIIASGASDVMAIFGGNGASTSASGSTITVNAPNSYGSIQIVGENTNELDYTLSASSGSDTLTIRSGTGINITSSTNNDVVIEAIGVSIPANRSVGNLQLSEMPSYSIKVAQANGEPTDIYQSEEVLEITYPVLADYYDVYYTTNGERVFRDPVSLIEYPSIYSEVLGYTLSTGTPDAIAGFVYGRVVDEAGNVSEIKPLNRRDLRLLLGASDSGFLEENGTLFSGWQLFDGGDLYNNIGSGAAISKSGTINIIAGTGISLEQESVGSGESAIKITATGETSAFGTIENDTTSETLSAGTVGATLHITERDAVGIDVSSNNVLDFYIKTGTVTNDMLAEMTENTVKVSTGDTNDHTPIDLYIDENQILGRPSSGNIKALSASEVRTIIGLTSADYFKSILCYTGVTLSGTVNSSSTETLTLRGGSNIALTVLGDNSIRIDATTDSSMYGIKTVSFTETGSTYTPTHFVYDELSLSSSNGIYKNIDIIPAYSAATDTLTTTFDLGAMPQRSVKVSGTSYNAMRGGYLATNLVVSPGNVIGVAPSGTSVTNIPFSTIVNNSGINYFSSVSVNGYIVSASGSSRINLVSSGDASLSYSSGNIIISSQSTLESDTTPTLGGNLDLNSNYLMNDLKKSLYISNTLTTTTNHYLNIENSASKIEFKAIRDTSSATSIDLVLTPFGTGFVVANRISSSTASNLVLKTGTSDGVLYVDGANANATIVSATSEKSLYLSPGTNSNDLRFYFNNGITNRSLIARRITNDTALIHSNLSGNLILCAGYTGSTISTGTNSIQMNSDVLMNSAKTIRSLDNIVKILTTDSGYLKLSGTTKSALHKVFSNTFVPASTRVVDSYKLESIGSAAKYIIKGENAGDPDDVFLLEFNVIVSASEAISNIVSMSYPSTSPTNTQNVTPSVVSNGTDIEVSLNTISNNYTLTVYRTTLV